MANAWNRLALKHLALVPSGLAVGIGANIAALMAMTARFDDAMEVAGEVERTSRRLGLIPLQAAALLMQGFAMAHQGRIQGDGTLPGRC